MSLSVRIMDEMKTAMRAKDTLALEALRAIKSGILLAQTESGAKEDISEEEEIKLLQAAVIEKFLPAQLSEAEVEAVVARIIADNDASGMASMGKVMGLVSAELAGKADGKTISTLVKK